MRANGWTTSSLTLNEKQNQVDSLKPSAVPEQDNKAAATQPSVKPTGTVLPLSDADHVLGEKNAPLTLIEYSDIECPYCQGFHATMLQILKDYQGKVKWVFRHFPLSFHPQAKPAAEAAECAGEQGKFWEYINSLYENQTLLGADYYQTLAQNLKLDLTKFTSCLASDKYLSRIDQDTQGGSQAGVTGTPGSFLIGKDGSAQTIKGALPYSSIKAMIDAALK